MHAPGYATLVAWTQGNVKPTPVAVGDALTYVSEIAQGDVLAVDVGGATTDVFSVIDGEFYRTVSACLLYTSSGIIPFVIVYFIASIIIPEAPEIQGPAA